jgi:hypothetical protein
VDVTEAEVVRPPARQPAKRLLPGEPPGPWKYSWAQGDNRVDLVARGTLRYRGQSHIALEILLDGVAIARAAITPTYNLLFYQKVGMRLPAAGELESRCERIKFDLSKENWGPRVEAGALEAFAPKIESLQVALNLRKRGKALPLPKLPETHNDQRCVYLNREGDRFRFAPVIVRIEQRLTTEPVVHVQWFSFDDTDQERIDCYYSGTSLMSWQDTVTLARYSEIYAKVSLPQQGWLQGTTLQGSWYPVRVEAGITRNGGSEFAHGLFLNASGIPEEIQHHVRRYKDVYTAPLDTGRCGAADWGWGFMIPDREVRGTGTAAGRAGWTGISTNWRVWKQFGKIAPCPRDVRNIQPAVAARSPLRRLARSQFLGPVPTTRASRRDSK